MFSEDIEYWGATPEVDGTSRTRDSHPSHAEAVDLSYRRNCQPVREHSEESTPQQPSVRTQIQAKCEQLALFLLRKNDAYGDSIFNSVNVFSQLSANEAILVRIDDKLSRIKNGTGYPGDNDIVDLIGYLMIWATKQNVEFK